MSYEFYKVIHVTSWFAVMMGLGSMLLQAMVTGQAKFPHRRWVMLFHGIGLAFAFISGFGLLARLELTGSWPLWVWIKVALWLYMGVVAAMILRRPKMAKAWWFVILILAGFAVYLARYKPF